MQNLDMDLNISNLNPNPNTNPIVLTTPTYTSYNTSAPYSLEGRKAGGPFAFGLPTIK